MPSVVELVWWRVVLMQLVPTLASFTKLGKTVWVQVSGRCQKLAV
ncbi:MAG: hypothetical protein ACRD11_00020 [Terriglobia bacterium]